MLRRFIWLILLAWLAGCSSLPTDSPGVVQGEGEEPVAIASPERWTWHGRFAARVENEGVSASLSWRQELDDFDIDIFDPLGRHLAELNGSSEAVTIRTREGDEHSARNAEDLLLHYLGWSIPISGMRHWVVGQAVPDSPVDAETFMDDGLRESLSQDGWSIEWQSYQEDGHEYLPQRMRLSRADLSLKLIMDDWWVRDD